MDTQAHKAAFSIEEFCFRNGGFCRSTYYKMKRAGTGPREMQVGARVIITLQAETDWHREREAEALVAAKKASEVAGRSP